ncbi:MAG: FAD-dependent oxidoreductase [Candidatus Omnitrophota bacterium]
MHDLIIIGAGPAGITASVYAARKRMAFAVISVDIGGQTSWSGDVENYTGYQFVSGPELAGKFADHMKQYSIDVREGEKAAGIARNGDNFTVTTDSGVYHAKSVIIATGKRSKELGVPGEKEFKNKGLTYCATCDGPLFSGKDVAVIGGGNSALDAALQLRRIARKVYVVNNTDRLGGDPIMREKVLNDPVIDVRNGTVVTEILGERFVTGMGVKSSGAGDVIGVSGIFVEIGLIPNTDFVTGVDKNAAGEIMVDSFNRTSVPGIFAAGDVTDVPEKQIIIAAGEGAKAALSVFRYLIALRA